MSDDLTTMIPLIHTVKVGDEDIVINTLKVGKLSSVLEAIKPFAHLMPREGSNPSSSPIDFVSLVIDHTPAVIKLTSIILDKPVQWVEELELDSLVDILSKIVEVNLDFFIQKVLPSVSTAMGQLGNVFQAKMKILNGR